MTKLNFIFLVLISLSANIYAFDFTGDYKVNCKVMYLEYKMGTGLMTKAHYKGTIISLDQTRLSDKVLVFNTAENLAFTGTMKPNFTTDENLKEKYYENASYNFRYLSDVDGFEQTTSIEGFTWIHKDYGVISNVPFSGRLFPIKTRKTYPTTKFVLKMYHSLENLNNIIIETSKIEDRVVNESSSCELIKI